MESAKGPQLGCAHRGPDSLCSCAGWLAASGGQGEKMMMGVVAVMPTC